MFQRHQIFDATQRTGVTCYTRGKTSALALAMILSAWTERMHDFAPVESRRQSIRRRLESPFTPSPFHDFIV